MKKKSLVLFILILTRVSYLGAQQANVWVFGSEGGLNFNFNPPKPFVSDFDDVEINGNGDSLGLSLPDNSASICDCRGNLLFYSDGHITWNRYGQYMPHGFRTRCIDSISFENATVNIIPDPGDSFLYYVFYGAGGGGNGIDKHCNGLACYTIDMRLDSGRGDATSTHDSLLNNHVSPYLTALKQPNGTGWWLLYLYASDTLYAYPVTSKGIGPPVISIIKYDFQGYNSGSGIQFNTALLKANHRGDKLLFASSSEPDTNFSSALVGFDSKTGKASGQDWLWNNVDTGSQHYYGPTGGEFSANDSLVYIATAYQHAYQFQMAQYLTYSHNPDSTVIRIPFADYYNNNIGFSMQLGPDEKIYTSNLGDTTLGIIYKPDKRGLACHFVNNALSIAPAVCGYTMPSIFVPLHPILWQASGGCSDTVYFSDYSDTVYFHSFIWAFGDGDSATGITAKHHYTKSGRYLLTLAAINGCGSYAYASDSIYAKLPVNNAGFLHDSSHISCGHTTVYLHGTATNPDSAVYYTYSFGDGSRNDTTRSPAFHSPLSHSYSVSGTYKIIQTATNGFCQDTASLTVKINVQPAPVAAFSTLDTAGCAPYPVQLTNTSKNAYSYLWEIDSTTDTSFSFSFSILKPGKHSIKLYAYNRQGCTDSLTATNLVSVVPAPVSAFTYATHPHCTADSVIFTNTSTNANKYLWSFTDTAASPARVYSKDTNYKISLIASNNYCADTSRQTIAIAHLPSPAVKFLYDKITCIGAPIQFRDTSAIPGASYNWNFGDSSIHATLKDPVHTYSLAAVYPVTETLANPAGCTAFKTDTIAVHPLPTDTFTDTINIQGEAKFTQTNVSPANTYLWHFGDSPTDTTPALNPQHIYVNSGRYLVSLLTTSTATGCSSLDTMTVFVTITGINTYIYKYNLQIFPNPFTSQTTIEATIPATNPVSLAIYDITGRQITAESNVNHPSGQFTYTFDAAKYGCQSGVYIVKLMIGNDLITKEIVRLP